MTFLHISLRLSWVYNVQHTCRSRTSNTASFAGVRVMLPSLPLLRFQYFSYLIIISGLLGYDFVMLQLLLFQANYVVVAFGDRGIDFIGEYMCFIIFYYTTKNILVRSSKKIITIFKQEMFKTEKRKIFGKMWGIQRFPKLSLTISLKYVYSI